MAQQDKRNLSMMMDMYELTMANGYFCEGIKDTYVTFDVFYRKNPDNGGFAIFAGLEQIIEYIENLHFEKEDIEYLRAQNVYSEDFLEYLSKYRFTGEIFAFEEGRVMYPSEPIITVRAPLIDAQLIETAILNIVNHQSLIATKARRIVQAAQGRMVSDFGARRAHNMDSAVYGARAAYIGGVQSTATVMAAQQFDIPVTGTMAHSWIMYFDDEFTAFKKFAETYPDMTILLVDTYDVIESGIPNAIRIQNEVLGPMGKRVKGVRIDSGDLSYLSKKVRRMLDEAGMEDCRIVASNSLDEYTITSILNQGGCIDSFGVGERLITAKSDPVFGAVYKIVEVETEGKRIPKMKVSETVQKITDPGRKEVYRIFDRMGHAVSDYIACFGEEVDMSSSVQYINPQKPWKTKHYDTDYTAVKLQLPVMKNTERLIEKRSLKEIQAFVKEQMDKQIWKEEQRFENPHIHYMDMSPDFYNMKIKLLESYHVNEKL